MRWDMRTGVIFHVEEFAIHDGPGIRRMVFLKGCPLRCSWCHNPEGLAPYPQMMVSKSNCISCGACERACSQSKCIACGACVSVCPLNLRKIVGTRLSSGELADIVKEKSDYYGRYGGGVTFSGGEPLMQGDFLLEVLDQISGINCALETSGYAAADVFRRVVERMDYIFLDLKIMERNKHIKYTGVDNAVILENAEFLCRQETPFVIRIPLIPGVNDDEENYERTARFLSGAKALVRVELLPYNKAAGAKYPMLEAEYTPQFDQQAQVGIRQDIFKKYGIRSAVL